jgi:hypothetical protein
MAVIFWTLWVFGGAGADTGTNSWYAAEVYSEKW